MRPTQLPRARAPMRAPMHFIDEMPGRSNPGADFNLAFLPRFAAMCEEDFAASAESKPLRKEFMLTMGRKVRSIA